MVFAICLIIVSALALTNADFIKKNARLLYVLSTFVSAAVIIGTALGISKQLPKWLRVWVWNPFAWGAFATAVFVVVMFAGAVSRGSLMQKKLMPIRAELSIIASILTLGHNFSAGQTYFVLLFTQPSKLPVNQLAAAVCSLVMLCIMLPLFITSFPKVRKKMVAKTWKKLQRTAYVFYGLIYVHVLLLAIPRARAGHTSAVINIAIFSVVFLGYGVMRVRKALDNRAPWLKHVPAIVATLICIGVVGMSTAQTQVEAATEAVAQAPAAESEVAPQKPEAVEKVLPDKAAPAVAEEKQVEAPQVNEGVAQEKQTPAPQDTAKERVTEPQAGAVQKTAEAPKTAAAAKTATAPKTTAAPITPAPEKKSGNAQQPETAAVADKKEAVQESKPPKAAPEKSAPPAAEAAPPQVTYKYKNGTFSGSGEGFGGTITVNVTIKDDVISNITVASHNEDEPFWSDGKTVIKSILSAQSASVDTVSGATFSSTGIKNAVAAALKSAKN